MRIGAEPPITNGAPSWLTDADGGEKEAHRELETHGFGLGPSLRAELLARPDPIAWVAGLPADAAEAARAAPSV